MATPETELAAGLASLGMDPKEAAEYAASKTPATASQPEKGAVPIASIRGIVKHFEEMAQRCRDGDRRSAALGAPRSATAFERGQASAFDICADRLRNEAGYYSDVEAWMPRDPRETGER